MTEGQHRARPAVLFTREHVATMFGVSGRTIANWQLREDDPIPVFTQAVGHERLRYHPVDVLEWAYRQKLLALGMTPEDQVDPLFEQALLSRSRREQIDLKNAQTRLETFDRAAITQALGAVATHANSILTGLPAKLKRLQPTMTAAQYDVLRGECATAANAIANVGPVLAREDYGEFEDAEPLDTLPVATDEEEALYDPETAIEPPAGVSKGESMLEVFGVGGPSTDDGELT